LTEDAGKLYLRGASRDELKAFRMACIWQEKFENLVPILVKKAGDIIFDDPAIQPILTKEDTTNQLIAFMRERHFRKFFPDGRSD
jgi:hypothetical protein